VLVYKPSFVKLEVKGGKKPALDMIRGDRREIQTYLPSAPEEIRKLLEKSTVARLFEDFPAKVAGKFEKIRPLRKMLCKATFQAPFVK
jgi:hypothetical protein